MTDSTELPSYREIMQTAWLGGLDDGTPCGRGSTMANTRAIRDLLPRLVENYDIRTVADAGAGDMHWIKHVQWDVEYQGYDLIPRHPDVREWDITLKPLPKVDLILCRFVIGHLDPISALTAVNMLRKSGSTYLLASNPQYVDYDTERYGTFNKWDLSLAPFGLGDPLEKHSDATEHDICLWKL